METTVLGISPTIWLIVQGVLAAIAVLIWFVRVLPNLDRAVDRRVLLEVWMPMAMIVPIVSGTVYAGENVSLGASWMPIGGVVLIAMVAMGVSLWRREAMKPSALFVHSGYAATVWLITGIMLLMLAAAQVLTVLVGQCVFAIAAVVMWMNTPSEKQLQAVMGEADCETIQRAHHRAATFGVLLIMLLAIGQSVAVIGAGAAQASVSGAVALSAALVMLVSGALAGPAVNGFRLAGWTASLGVLFAVGVLSLIHVSSFALQMNANRRNGVVSTDVISIEVSHGFAALSPEAAGLIAIGLLAVVGDRMLPVGRKIAGTGLALVGTCLLLWRLL